MSHLQTEYVHLFMPPLTDRCEEALCFRVVRPRVLPCVRPCLRPFLVWVLLVRYHRNQRKEFEPNFTQLVDDVVEGTDELTEF